MATPYKSIFNDKNLQSVLQGIAQLQTPAEAQTQSPFANSSGLNDARVQSALEGIAQLQAPAEGQTQSPFANSSGLNDARVQSALEGIAQLQTPSEAQTQSPFANSSGLNDARVQSAIQGITQLQPLPDGRQAANFPSASAFNDSRVQSQIESANQLASDGPAAFTTIKNSFNGGEISPDMQARFDLPRFQMGCEKLLNMVPLPGGGLTKRPGFDFVDEVDVGDPASRLVPFIYSSELQFMILLLANDGGGIVAVLPRDGGAEMIDRIWVPYLKSELHEVSICQCGKILYLAHANHKPGKLILQDDGSFKFEEIDFDNHVQIPSITGLYIEGQEDENAPKGKRTYVVTAVDWQGRESFASPEATMETASLSSTCKCRVQINHIPMIHEYRVYKRRGSEFGYVGRITSGNTFDDEGYSPDVTDQPPERKSFFVTPGDYPSICFLHQQRLGWASTNNNPLTIWMSQTSNFECLESKTPPADDDAIEVTLASTQANKILWCMSDRTGLAIGTGGEEWYLTGANGESGLSPNSLSFQQQTHYGTEAGVNPVRAEKSLFFVQRGGRYLRDFGYSFQSDRYEAQDLTLLARHLFRYAQIKDMAWQGTPANILWCVLSTGRLLGMTYMPDQEVIGWHKHETDGLIQSCASIYDSQGRCRLWIVVRRGNQVFVEMLGNFYEGQPDEWDNLPEVAKPAHYDGINRLPFKARVIPCLPEQGMENAHSTMRVRKINAIKFKVMNCAPFEYSIISQNLKDTKPQRIPPKALIEKKEPYAESPTEWSCPVGAGFRDGAKLEIILDSYKPATILGMTVTLEVARETGSQPANVTG